MKHKVIVIDHDRKGMALLKQHLQSHTLQLELAGEANSCEEGIKLLKNVSPNLVLIGAKLPDGTGFDVLKNVGSLTFDTIIITALEKVTVPTHYTNILYFLRKPISKEQLDNALQRFYQQHNVLAEKQRRISPEIATDQKIKIPQLHGYDIVSIKEIVRLQANGSYTKIFFSSGKETLVSKHLKTYEEGLQSLGFVRIHKSHIVNTAYIKSIRKGKKGIVVMKDDTPLYFSNIYRKEILEHFID